MKPKYHRLMRRAFPSLIVVPAILQLATAADFNPDTAGNILVPGNYDDLNGQDFTIRATGGLGTSFTALIESGVIFTGDAVRQVGMQVTVAGYTITNNGSLSGQDNGVEGTASFILNNTGSIAGGTGPGIDGFGGTTVITNELGATIIGGGDGIFFANDGGTVVNRGSIQGFVDGDGVDFSNNNGTVTNFGSIIGADSGIEGDDGISITNTGTITATNDGVNVNAGLVFHNQTVFDGSGNVDTFGVINAGALGIDSDDNADIINDIASTITGGTTGIFANDDADIRNNGGVIVGTAGTGVAVDGDGVVVNQSGSANGTAYQARITGGIHGVDAGAGSYIYNTGLIEGITGTGVIIDSGASSYASMNVDNFGTIRGAVDGVFAGDDIYIYNAGEIIGTTGSGVLAGEDLELDVFESVTGVTGVTTTAGSALVNVYGGTVTGTGGTALSLGDGFGVGGNEINLYNLTTINGDIIATGTGNSIFAGAAEVFGDIAGIQDIEIDTEGFLNLQGDIATPTTILANNDSELTGNGSWLADIDLRTGATFYASDSNGPSSAGVIDIDGNVDHQAGSFIRTVISAFDTIENDGTTATLLQSSSGVYDADDAIISLDIGGPLGAIRDGDYVIVEATGGIVTGGGNEIWFYDNSDSVLGNFFAQSSNFTGDLVVSVDHDFESLPGLSGNQQAAGAALDAFMESESALPSGDSNDYDLRFLIGSLDAGDLGNAQNVLGALVAPGEGALSLTQSVVNSNYRIHRLVQNHLASARSSADIVSQQVGTSSAKEVPAAPTRYSRKGNVWGSFAYDWQDYDGEGDNSDFDGEVASFTAGFDYRVAPDFILGLLLDGSQADVDGNGQTTDIDSFRATLYGSYGGSTGIYSDFLVGYGTHDNDFTDADSLQALLTVGYAMGTQQLKHGPYAGLEYQRVNVDGFGSDDFLGVDVDDFDVDSLRALVGYRVNGDLGRFKPYASISYAHEFEDGGNHVTSSIGAASFRVEGGEQGSAILLTAGTGITLTSALTFDVGYRGEICVENEGMDSHGGNIGLNWAF